MSSDSDGGRSRVAAKSALSFPLGAALTASSIRALFRRLHLPARDPLIDFGTQETPAAAQAKRRQIASFDHSVRRGRVTLQIVGDLIQRHHFRLIQ